MDRGGRGAKADNADYAATLGARQSPGVCQYPKGVHCRQIAAAVKQGGTADGFPFVLDNENSGFSVGGVFCFPREAEVLMFILSGRWRACR